MKRRHDPSGTNRRVSVSMSPADERRLERLQSAYGYVSVSECVRRAVAEALERRLP